MAANTNIKLRNQMIYSVYVRNHTEEGTFKAIIPDLDRIKKLGTDIIWFMPIHPIGVEGKKGSLGCPYSISDYRKVNAEYGTMEDFRELVDTIHEKGMKCIIDVVYNHTSRDSWLVKNHRDYFYTKTDGSTGNHIGDWTDVIDLDYNNKELWEYQIETLKMWAEIVDGFRCDVASLVPLDFWKKAREEVQVVRPGCIWLAETIEGSFIRYVRSMGLQALSDSQVYDAFDITYEYDIWGKFEDYFNKKIRLSELVTAVNNQEWMYPEEYIKLRFLENHDRPRIASRISSQKELENLTAFTYFQKGTMLVYAGEEFADSKLPSLFDKDTVVYDKNKDMSVLFEKLHDIKQNKIFAEGTFNLEADDATETVTGTYTAENKLTGIFCLNELMNRAKVSENIPDGDYINLINNEIITVANGTVDAYSTPIIFATK